MTIIFQTYCLNYSNKTFLVRKLFFLFCTIFYISANFRVLIPNISFFFPILSLQILKRTFLVPNLRIFIFAQNVFKLLTQNYTSNAFLAPKLKLLCCTTSLFTSLRVLIPVIRIFLKILV